MKPKTITPPAALAAPPATPEPPAVAETAAPPLALSSPALRIMLDDRLFSRCETIARYMSTAHGMMPAHLINQPAACFAVVNRALAWNLDPYAVAGSTYQTPGGRVGFEGKLISAILEASGQLRGGLRYRHVGDWSKVSGKFTLKASKNGGKPFPVPAWNEADEEGLGVEISAHLRGEAEPRTMPTFWLVQAYPRNSTLWATDPRTQLVYLATRRFASLVVPHLLMGLPWDGDDGPEAAAIDVTPPRPTRESVAAGGIGERTSPPARVETDAPTEADAADDDPRSGMNEEERDRVEREADRLLAAAARGEATTDESEETADADNVLSPIPVPQKADGSPDWIKWHTEVAKRAADVPPGLRATFVEQITPALQNYHAISPKNAAALRNLVAGRAGE